MVYVDFEYFLLYLFIQDLATYYAICFVESHWNSLEWKVVKFIGNVYFSSWVSRVGEEMMYCYT